MLLRICWWSGFKRSTSLHDRKRKINNFTCKATFFLCNKDWVSNLDEWNVLFQNPRPTAKHLMLLNIIWHVLSTFIIRIEPSELYSLEPLTSHCDLKENYWVYVSDKRLQQKKEKWNYFLLSLDNAEKAQYISIIQRKNVNSCISSIESSLYCQL